MFISGEVISIKKLANEGLLTLHTKLVLLNNQKRFERKSTIHVATR